MRSPSLFREGFAEHAAQSEHKEAKEKRRSSRGNVLLENSIRKFWVVGRFSESCGGRCDYRGSVGALREAMCGGFVVQVFLSCEFVGNLFELSLFWIILGRGKIYDHFSLAKDSCRL